MQRSPPIYCSVYSRRGVHSHSIDNQATSFEIWQKSLKPERGESTESTKDIASNCWYPRIKIRQMWLMSCYVTIDILNSNLGWRKQLWIFINASLYQSANFCIAMNVWVSIRKRGIVDTKRMAIGSPKCMSDTHKCSYEYPEIFVEIYYLISGIRTYPGF